MPSLRLSPPLEPYRGLIVRAAERNGVDPALLAGVLQYESGGNPNATHPASGATGLGQVMPREAGFPDRPTRQELLDPGTNIEWAARILASGVQHYGPEGGLAAYLGAVDPKTGKPTTAADANGTTGIAYVQAVMKHANAFGYSPSGGAGGNSVADTPLISTLRAQLEEDKQAEKDAQTRLIKARSALTDAQNLIANQSKADAALGKNDAALKAAQQEVNDAAEAQSAVIARRRATETKLATEEGRPAADTTADNPYAGSPSAAAPKLYNKTTGQWEDNPAYVPPKDAADKPADPSLVAEREASAAQSRAQAGYYEQLTRKAAQEAIAQEVANQKRQEIEQLLKVAEGKDPAQRLAAIQALAEQATLLDDPKAYLTFIQNQATQQFTKWQQLQQDTGQRYDPLTLLPLLGPDGQPIPTAEAKQRQEALDAQKRQEEAQQRQEMARGAQAVAGLESQRAEAFNQAMGQFEQSGVATGGRIAGLNALRQPLAAGEIALMLGLSEDDPKFQRYMQLRGQLQGANGTGTGAGGQPGQPGVRPSGQAGNLPPGTSTPPGTGAPPPLAARPPATAPNAAPVSAAAGLVQPPVPGAAAAGAGLPPKTPFVPQAPAAAPAPAPAPVPANPAAGPAVSGPVQPGQTVAPPSVQAPPPAPAGLTPLQRLLAQSGITAMPNQVAA